MRVNVYVASATGLSRRAADKIIADGKVLVNGLPAQRGQEIDIKDEVTIEGRTIYLPEKTLSIILNKPRGYVTSREGQGSKTIYDLLPAHLHSLKPVGRLDKESSGLLLLTNDGQLAHKLTHPSFQKDKVYEVSISKPLSRIDLKKISNDGVLLEDGASRLRLSPLSDNKLEWQVTMQEGRNRQIRRTFSALGYGVVRLHRIQFGEYKLGNIINGALRQV